MFSPSTVTLFDSLLAQYKLAANAENFETMANAIALARAELRAYYKIQKDQDANSRPKDDPTPAPTAPEEQPNADQGAQPDASSADDDPGEKIEVKKGGEGSDSTPAAE